jgi:glycosyltransferase involved in cell wall biosynthesis
MIFAIMMVRNEADIVRVNLLYHLGIGIDHVLVVDNGSTDGTLGILEELATTSRVHVVSRPGPFYQAETTTEFAREAFLRGARWVLPIDADEFWHVPGGRLRDVLDEAADAGALEVEVVNFVQRREQETLDTRALVTMTRRVPTPVGNSGDASELVESSRISFVECRYPPKYVSRATIALQIGQGNHSVTGTDGPLRKTAAIVCLHAPLRARAALAVQKVEQGRRVEEVNHYLRQAWHVRRWRRLADEGGIDAEWAANSYREDCLDVDGAKHPLAIDTSLRELVEPWIEANVSGTMKTLPAPPAIASTPPPAAESDSVIKGEILERISGVEGWLRDEEAALLIQSARRALTELDVPAVVEVGSFCGKSTIALASAARSINPSARVYAIDPHLGEVGAEGSADGIRVEPPTFDRFQQNVSEAGVAEVIDSIRQRSYDVRWRSPIAFLFIDGLHDYTSVARDFFHFEPHLPTGAYVAFHDCDDNYPGVRAFVAGLAASTRYEEVTRAASLVVLRKVVAPANGLGVEGVDSPMALSLRVSQQEKGIAFLVAEIAARDRTLRERDEGIDWLRGVIRDKELTIAELEKGVAWLRTEVAERERTIEVLRRASAPVREALGRHG